MLPTIEENLIRDNKMHQFPKFSFNKDLYEIPKSIKEFEAYVDYCQNKLKQLEKKSVKPPDKTKYIATTLSADDSRIKKRKYLSLLGAALRILRKLDEAEKAHSKALGLCLPFEVEIIINCNIRLAQVYQWQGYFEKSNTIFAMLENHWLEKTNNQNVIGTFWQHYGKNKFDQKAYRPALKYFENALTTRQDCHAAEDLIESTRIAIARTQTILTPNPVVDGTRIKLVARDREQAAELLALINRNRSHLEPWMPWVDHTKNLEDLLSYLESAMSWWQNATTYDFTIYLKSTNEIIGSMGLHSLDWDKQSCAIGYWITKSHEGQGFITEGVKLLEQFASQLGFHRVVITCDRLNERSSHVPNRLGYVFESLQIDESFSNGKHRDTLSYVKLLDRGVPNEITENLPYGYCIIEGTTKDFESYCLANYTNKEPRPSLNISKSLLLKYHNEVVGIIAVHINDIQSGKSDKSNKLAHLNKSSHSEFNIVKLSVIQNHRGRGLYSRLLSELIMLAKRSQFNKINVQIQNEDHNSLFAFLKEGFVITGVTQNKKLMHKSLQLNLTFLIKAKPY